MAGNYEKSIYNQLMEVMARLDHVEKENRQEVSQLNIEISDLKKIRIYARRTDCSRRIMPV